MTAGRLFPAAGGLVARTADSFTLVNRDGQRVAIDGPICDEIAASLADQRATPRLRSLASAHAAIGELVEWLATPSVPLTALDAVRLDGFDTLFLELLGRCNERCVHCYADSAPTVDAALDRETVLGVIDQAAALGFRRIQLTGGDPLLCEFLVDAVAHARARRIPEVEIYTNGLALHDELADRLAPHRPGFAFSMYSLDPDEHDRLTRTPGSQRRTLAAIDRALARGLDVRVSIIVIDQQVGVQALIDHLRARGVKSIAWTRTFSVGRGVEHYETSHDTEVAVALPGGGGHAIAGGHTGKLCVTYTGDVVPCIFQRSTVLGDARAGGLLAIAQRRSRTRAGLPVVSDAARRLQCASCRLTELALGFAEDAA